MNTKQGSCNGLIHPTRLSFSFACAQLAQTHLTLTTAGSYRSVEQSATADGAMALRLGNR